MDVLLRRLLPLCWALLAAVGIWLVGARWAGERQEAREVTPAVVWERWPDGTLAERALPPVYADPDSSCWIEYAQTVAGGSDWRYRESPIGNAPFHRPMLWSHPYLWWSLAVGWVHARWQGISWTDGIGSGMALTNPIAFVLLVGAWVVCVGRRVGWTAAAGGWAVLGASTGVASDFGWWHPDHHGFHLAAMLGSATALYLGLRTCEPGEDAGPGPRLFAWAGALNGFGLWIGATQQLALTGMSLGIAGLGALLLPRPQLGRWAQGWTAWSAGAAGVAVLGTAVEFGPTFEQARLEVVHPLHSALALSAAAFARGLTRWRLGERGAFASLALGLALAVMYPAAIALSGAEGYLLRDPVVWRSTANIAEFQRLHWGSSPRGIQLEFGLALVVLALLLGQLVSGWRRERTWNLATLWAALLLAAMLGLWLLQVRWRSWAEAACVLGLLALLGRPTNPAAPTPRWQRVAPCALAGWVACLLVLEGRAALARRGISPALSAAVGARDLALELRRSVGPGPIRVLGSPSWAPCFYLYGRVESVDALYWENGPGTIAANLLLSEADPAQAERRVRERGLTHLLVEASAARVAYVGWVGLGTRRPEEMQRTLIYALAHPRPKVPDWLEWVGTVPLLGHSDPVRIYRVRPPAGH